MIGRVKVNFDQNHENFPETSIKHGIVFKKPCNWVVAAQIFLEFSSRTLGFHDPV